MMDNTKNHGKLNTYSRIVGLVRPYRLLATLTIILAAVNVTCTLYAPIMIGRAIDHIIDKGNVDFTFIIPVLIKIIITVVIGALAQYFVSFISNKLAMNIVRDLRKSVFKHILRLPLKYIDSHPIGDIVSRVIADADQFADGMLMGFTQLFTGVATIIGTLAFMFYLQSFIAIVVVIVTPLSFFVAKYIASHTYNLFKDQSVIRGQQTSQIEEGLNLVKVIRAYGIEEDIKRDFDETNEKLSEVGLLALFYSSLTNPSTRFVNSVMYALVALTGALYVISGGMTVGVWSCFLSYATQYTKPFNEITSVITELQGAFACANRIFELLDEDEEPRIIDAHEFIDVEGNISIKDIDFSYNKEVPLIENFSLEVKKGQKVAIVGPTGCGKTTFINLLMRFYDPDMGTISLDDINILDASKDSLRSSYGMVLQETWLRKGTIADNIRMGKPQASMEEIIAAAKETHAHSFIRRLPNGYDTVITEDGGALSAGQKQLLCISRIMLMMPPMLILDEATSNIDTRTELKIQDAFYKLMDGKTSFVVAHRLSTIIGSDVILVMNKGKIVEQGTHSQLLELGGFYAGLYNAGLGR